jgi:hypothetical protein
MVISLIWIAVLVVSTGVLLYALPRKGYADFYYLPRKGSTAGISVELAPVRWISGIIAFAAATALLGHLWTLALHS